MHILIKSLGLEKDEGLALGRKRGKGQTEGLAQVCSGNVSERKAGFKLFNSLFLELIFKLLPLPFICKFCHLFFPLGLMHFVSSTELFLFVTFIAVCVGIVGTSC